MPNRRLLLIDGTNILYRAFFAIADLATDAGQPTNAVFGFVRMLRQWMRQWQPTHRLVVWDGGTPERRKVLLPGYKAHRPAMPDKLRQQFAPADEYLDRAGIAHLRMEGEEADDVIASVAQRAAANAEVLLVTSDKDILQLVTERIKVIVPVRAEGLVGPAEVLQKYGVRPDQIVDWLALTGDAVDNIPGVPGLGPKTATRLLERFGSIEAIWARLAEVEPERIRTVLMEHKAQVSRNVELVRLDRNLVCAAEWEQCAVRAESPERLLPFYQALEFHSLARELQEGQLPF